MAFLQQPLMIRMVLAEIIAVMYCLANIDSADGEAPEGAIFPVRPRPLARKMLISHLSSWSAELLLGMLIDLPLFGHGASAQGRAVLADAVAPFPALQDRDADVRALLREHNVDRSVLTVGTFLEAVYVLLAQYSGVVAMHRHPIYFDNSPIFSRGMAGWPVAQQFTWARWQLSEMVRCIMQRLLPPEYFVFLAACQNTFEYRGELEAFEGRCRAVDAPILLCGDDRLVPRELEVARYRRHVSDVGQLRCIMVRLALRLSAVNMAWDHEHEANCARLLEAFSNEVNRQKHSAELCLSFGVRNHSSVVHGLACRLAGDDEHMTIRRKLLRFVVPDQAAAGTNLTTSEVKDNTDRTQHAMASLYTYMSCASATAVTERERRAALVLGRIAKDILKAQGE